MPYLQLRFPRLHYVRFKSEKERAEMNRQIAKSLGVPPVDYARKGH
jgi:transketolase